MESQLCPNAKQRENSEADSNRSEKFEVKYMLSKTNNIDNRSNGKLSIPTCRYTKSNI